MKGMEELKSLAASCLGCPSARCAASCPCGNTIPEILSAVKQGDYLKASQALAETNPFPFLTSILCDHNRQCRGHCVRGIKGSPVDFPAVERALGELGLVSYAPGKPNGKRVAIIGAGPAGCSAAIFLLQAGFAVELYEKEASLGGAILTGIPVHRFGKEPLNRIKGMLDGLGATLHFGHRVGKEELESLARQYDYVFLAVGAEKENRLDAPECPDIHRALSLLYDLNMKRDCHDLDKKSHIVVMGGGNVAMDVAGSLVRLHGPKVTLIYRRDEASMPANIDEIEAVKRDGVVFSPLTNVSDYRLDSDGRLIGLEVVDMSLGEKDESGRPSFHVIEESENELPCDAFVMAIGEKSDLGSLVDLESLGGKLRAIGDCSYGAKNIAAAIKSGREAALALIEEIA